MKVCDYCGLENEDDAVVCRECGTKEFWPLEEETFAGDSSAANPSHPDASRPARRAWDFRKPQPKEMEQDLVTLVNCATLADADLVVSELASAGIEAFIPDEFASSTLPPAASEHVRVQVAPEDYELAKAFLSAVPQESDSGNP